MSPQPGGGSPYLAFSDLLTGYRASMVIFAAGDAGLFTILTPGPCPSERLCVELGRHPDFGQRALECLVALEVLESTEQGYVLSGLGRFILSQRHTLDFERQLFAAWQELPQTLQAGKRVFATGNKSRQELQQSMTLYLGAMDEAAQIRSREVWETFTPMTSRGVLLDMGAGSGRYAEWFLEKSPDWEVILCDLPEVVSNADVHACLGKYEEHIRWCAADLIGENCPELESIDDASCDLVLLSNFIHCQAVEETERLIARGARKMKVGGRLLIHDFFQDVDQRGALYDLHMMLNTYNGRTYRCADIEEITGRNDCVSESRYQLTSGSTLLVFRKTGIPQDIPG